VDDQDYLQFCNQIVILIPLLRRYCLSLAGAQDGGDDLLQLTLERALTNHLQLRSETKLTSWTFRIAQNINRNLRRVAGAQGNRVDVELLVEISGDDGRDIVERRSAITYARARIAALPSSQRDAMVLVVIDGLSYRKAAEMLNLPVGTVMSRIARARQIIGTLP
jgi:RNA polymerase sigma-70 factor, ECF subfamily